MQTHTSTPAPALPGTDPLGVRNRLSADERQRLEYIEDTLERRVQDQVGEPWNQERFTPELLPVLSQLGLGELVLDGSSHLFQGLVHASLARVDLSLSALVGIHNELNVGILHTCGSEEQKARWLPAMRKLESLGAFCLTEPNHGSDVAGGLETTATPTPDGWIIQGQKRWIGAGTLADIALVWARDTSDAEIKCFLVPTSNSGYSATKIENKIGLRIMHNADVTLNEVQVSRDALIPGATSFAAANDLLCVSRAWVGWQGVGAQQAILNILRKNSLGREQFGKPLARFQLIQNALAQIAGNLAASTSMMVDIARLQDEDQLAMPHAALVKSTSTRLARESVSLGRDAMGGNGIITDYGMAKIMGDVEAIHTYEGTYSINSLIVGRALTGLSAFV